MTTPFMRAYSQLVIKTCHQRGIHAMGGMSAFIPVKGDEALNEKAFAQVRADKEREVGDGHDGTWVAHPGMVALATEVFDQGMPQPNQISRQREDVNPTAAELLATPEGDDHRARVAHEYPCRRAIYRCLARRPRRRAAL